MGKRGPKPGTGGRPPKTLDERLSDGEKVQGNERECIDLQQTEKKA